MLLLVLASLLALLLLRSGAGSEARHEVVLIERNSRDSDAGSKK
jgi:hypothetical protein